MSAPPPIPATAKPAIHARSSCPPSRSPSGPRWRWSGLRSDAR